MKTWAFIIFGDLRDDVTGCTNIGYLMAPLKKTENLIITTHFYDAHDIDVAIEDTVQYAPDYIGLPLLQYNLDASLTFIRKIKTYLTDSIIIVGNVTATIFFHDIMRDYPEIDYTVIGEGEETLAHLVGCLLSGKNVKECRGIAYRNEGVIQKTSFRKPSENLDALLFPDRSYNKNTIGRYTITGSRGCDGHCTFCDANTLLKNAACHARVRYRSMANIIGEIKSLQQNYPVKSIIFYDSTFGNEKRLTDLYHGMLNNNIKIPFELNLRCDQIGGSLCHIMEKLIEFGLFRVFLGVEAGNNYDLLLYGKISDKNQNITALENMKYLYDTPVPRIQLLAGFINFNPYSTIAHIIENMDFLYTYKLLDFSTALSKLMISPSAPLAVKLQRDRLLTAALDYKLTCYAYRFAHDPVGKLFDAMAYLEDRLRPVIYFRMYPLYSYLKIHAQADRYEKSMLLLHEYNSLMSGLIYNGFNRIVDILGKDPGKIRDAIDKELSVYTEKVNSLKTELDKSGHAMAKACLSMP